jgi:hypothetical protein
MKILLAYINKHMVCIVLALYFFTVIIAQNQTRPNQYGQWLVLIDNNIISNRIGYKDFS